MLSLVTPESRSSDDSNWGWATVMVVDDDEISRMLLVSLVQKLGVGTVIQALDGRDCLDKLSQIIPDLIVMDVVMPHMNGIDVCRRIRETSRLADVPVLFQTALNSLDEQIDCFEAGGNDLVAKPLNFTELKARIRVQLENRRLVRSLRDVNRRMSQELEGAKRMQEALQPREHRLREIGAQRGLSIESVVQASQGLGGDFWMLQELDATTVAISTVDFSGHGVMAALNTFRLHTLISEFDGDRRQPSKFLAAINESLISLLPRGQFATMFYCVIDTAHSEIMWSAAGAPQPVLFADGLVELLDTTGLPLGISRGASYRDRVARFPDGARLFLYSDAISEAITPGGQQFGETGILETLAWNQLSAARLLLSDILDRFLAQVQLPLQDDLTAVLIRSLPPAKHALFLDADDLPVDQLEGWCSLYALPQEPAEGAGDPAPLRLISNVTQEKLAEALVWPAAAVVETLNRPCEIGLSRMVRETLEGGGLMMSLTTRTALECDIGDAFCDAIQSRWGIDGARMIDVRIALSEAISNSLIHGNLELGSTLRGSMEQIRRFQVLLTERKSDPHLGNRRIRLLASHRRGELTVSIRDEGPGYQPIDFEQAGADRPYGRGLDLMQRLTRRMVRSQAGREHLLFFSA